jgi:hypothetical protein
VVEPKIMKPPSEVVSAAEVESIVDGHSPDVGYYLSKKWDGYYLMVRGDGIFSSSMKSDVFRNPELHEWLAPVVSWCRRKNRVVIGEAVGPLGTSFGDLGALRSATSPLPVGYSLKVFDAIPREDYDKAHPVIPFGERMRYISECEGGFCVPRVNPVTFHYTQGGTGGDRFRMLVERWLRLGHEGAVLIRSDQTFKHGRVSRKAETLLKVKQFDPLDAVIIDVEEGWKTPDSVPRRRGPTGRLEPVAKGMKIRNGTFGRFKVRIEGGKFHGAITYIGRWKGWTKELGDRIWKDRDQWIGEWVRFESMSGADSLPRIPKNVQFRDPK